MDKYTPILMVILRAVDETGAAKELTASNKDNGKGNAWARLVDVCFGGGSGGRGLLGFSGLPDCSASVMKKKVTDAWNYAVTHESLTTEDIFNYCTRQNNEFNETKKKFEENKEKEKASDAKLQADMKDYQRGLGAIPPGAKGRQGGGRLQHSTNLRLGQPANFSFVRATSKAIAKPTVKTITSPAPPAAATVMAPETPNSSITASVSGGSSGKRSSTSMHTNALQSINQLTSNFERTAKAMGLGGKGEETLSRIDKMQMKVKALKDLAEFYRGLGDEYKEQYSKAMVKYGKANHKLMSLLDPFDSDSD